MSITTLNQELWSNLLIKGTTGQLAFADVVKHIGTVSGKTVHFSNIGDITINDYVKGTPLSNQELTDSGLDLNLDQQKYFSASIEDIDKAQSDVGIMTEVTRKGTLGLKKEVEKYIAGLHSGAGITSGLGSSTTPIEVNSANVLTYLRTIARKLDEAEADAQGRWVVIPAWFKEKLFIALPQLDTNNSEMLKTGYVGAFAGLKIYMSSHVVNTTGAKYKVLAGSTDSIRFGINIEKLEGLRDPNQFGDILRGLAVYGAKVIESTTLACLTANEAAEV